MHTDKPNFALTLDQKLHVASELLDALAHAHEHDVVHRNLTPSTLLLGTDGHLRIIGFDFARAGTDRSRSIAHEIVDDLEPMYQAPETFREPANASSASDMFSVGLVLYELFTGDKPFTSPTEVYDQGAIFPVKPSQARTGLPADIDEWLQKLCAFDPGSRPSARQARTELLSLLAKETGAPEEKSPATGGPRGRADTAGRLQPLATRDAAYVEVPGGKASRGRLIQCRVQGHRHAGRCVSGAKADSA